jgi:hypothetical protein
MLHILEFSAVAAWLSANEAWLDLAAVVLLVAIGLVWFGASRRRQRYAQQQTRGLTAAATALAKAASDADQKVREMQGHAAAAQASATAANTALAEIRNALAGDFGTVLQRLGETIGDRPSADERREKEDQELRVAGLAATIELTKAGFQALIVINGGAIVAILALLGSIWASSPTTVSKLIEWLAFGSLAFGLGLACAIVGIGEAFRAQGMAQKRVDKYRESTAEQRRHADEKLTAKIKRHRTLSYRIGAASVVLFGIGAVVVMRGLLLPDPRLELSCPADARDPCTILCPDGAAVVVDQGSSIAVEELTEGILVTFPGDAASNTFLAPAGGATCQFLGFSVP